MQSITKSLINSARKAAKFLHRDFLELEMLQKTPAGNDDFCNKSYLKAKNILKDELQKHSPFLFFPDDKLITDHPCDTLLLINPIDSVSNFARSIPFFALTITYLKKTHSNFTPISVATILPAIDSMYYAENGAGAWGEKSNDMYGNQLAMRYRVSGRLSLDNVIIATDGLDNIPSLFKNIRVFGSNCYTLGLFASGKLDCVCLSSLNYTLKYGFELLVKESGGIVIVHDGKFIATNYELAQKLKQQLLLR